MTVLRQAATEPVDAFELDDIVPRLRGLRAAANRRQARAIPPELPSRAAIIGIVDALAAALYPRHYGPVQLAGESADGFVAATLATALPALQQQILLELGLDPALTPQARATLPDRAATITRAFASELPEVRELLDSDIRAAYEGDPSAKSIDEVICCFPGIAAVLRHRLAHLLYTRGLTMVARLIAEAAHSQTGIDIHPGAQIGAGFFIDHGTGVVIGETAIIGRNVRLYQAVTLGAKKFEIDASGALLKDYPRHPIVEDDVVIYSGATVLGRITIGRGSSIGGNVWQTNSVPPGSHITQAKARSETFDDGAGI